MQNTLKTIALVALSVAGCRSSAAFVSVPYALELWPSSLVLAERQTRELVLTASGADGAKVGSPILWSSDDPGVATVSPNGVVSAVNIGTTLIRARVSSGGQSQSVLTSQSGIEDQTSVTVVAALKLAFSLEIVPGPDELTPRCRYRLTVVGVGGAPSDSATWVGSTLEFVDTTGAMQVLPISDLELVDRFGTQVIRSGDTLTSERFATNQTSNFRTIYRLRYMVESELRSESVFLECQRENQPVPGSVHGFLRPAG